MSAEYITTSIKYKNETLHIKSTKEPSSTMTVIKINKDIEIATLENLDDIFNKNIANAIERLIKQ